MTYDFVEKFIKSTRIIRVRFIEFFQLYSPFVGTF